MTLLDVAAHHPPARALPRAHRDRWQPVRAGLVDLFYYDEEEFAFHDGHLLLRGNNGTGKSKVLALLLPFLLDGDTSAHRVEPDGDPGKRMEWNLLLGGRHPHSERTGYAWCEFGRRDPAGQEHWLTVGAGLKAVSGRTGVHSWFFVTDRRVGADLHLVGEGRTVLTRSRLAEALGDRGTVYETAERYRRAVNETLFDLSPERYDALLTLLVQLRQPQLSKRPDERRLSAALTEALPPLDGAVVADVAEAFRSLEEERLALVAHTEARNAASRFLGIYRSYARIAARRRAGEPRTAQSRYEETGRQLAATRERLAQARAAEAATAQAQDQVRDDQARAEAEDRALQGSEDMRSAKELRRAEADADRAERVEADAAAEVAQATTERDRRVQQHADRSAEWEAAGASTAALREQAGQLAPTARVPDVDLTADGARVQAERDAATVEQGLAQVRRLAGAATRAAGEHAEAQRRREEAAQDVDRLAESVAGARAEVTAQADAVVAAARAWLAAAPELRRTAPGALAGQEEALDRLADWAETLAGDNPLVHTATSAGRAAVDVLAREDTGLAAEQAGAEGERASLLAERERLAGGEDLAPPPAPTRDHAARAGRAGAPLWRLVDFADDLAVADRAGLEAALEAAGLLDAWVTPDGGLLDADDAAITVGGPVDRPLSAALRPAVDRADPQAAAVPDDVVAAILSGIGLGAATAETWVGADGRFRVGVLEGRWRKDTAAYVGAGAREQARRARLAQIAAALDQLDAELAALAAARAALARRRGAVERELAALPGDAALRAAHAAAAEQTRAHQVALDRLAQRETAASAARERLAAALAERDAAAAQRGLPADDEGLAAVAAALTSYRLVLAQLWPALDARRRAERALADAADELARAEAVLGRRAEQLDAVREALRQARALRDGLRSTVGTAVKELEARLAAMARHRQALEVRARELDKQRLAHTRAVGEAEGREAELTGHLEEHAALRARATEALRSFARSGLLAAALPDLDVPDPRDEWAPTPAVMLARAVESALSDLRADDDAWERSTRQVTEGLAELGEVLSRSGNNVSYVPTDDGLVVTATFRGQDMTVAALAAALEEELAERERVLSAREREVLENHLVSEVAARLQELIRAAEAQVERMNQELAARPTSTGMQLRFVWTPVEDGPAGLAEARTRLLRQTSDAWSEADRAAVGDFLQAQIAAVRARDEGGTWSEHLTSALDYRAWHRFAVERRQDGRWRPATGPASGGERVLAATIPLFAAAASHYASAGNPHAPRLVLLDEAFAGVDDDSRAKCLGLLAEFDLDYVLTSEREWGCYPTVPGLAIAQLSRREGIDAVLVTRWQWDGRCRTRLPEPERSAVPAAAPQPRDGEPGLWG